MGTLAVDCDVPFILDAARISDGVYMASHFNDLIQAYCVTGVVGGNQIDDLVSYPERMYFGSHPPDTNVLSLTQSSMASIFAPSWAFRMDFIPDADVIPGSEWQPGVDEGEVMVVLMQHVTAAELCTFSVGYAGDLTVPSARNPTVEGGSFSVSGTVEMGQPGDIPGLCELFAGVNVPCCE